MRVDVDGPKRAQNDVYTPGTTTQKIERPKVTLYEKIVYALNILVPLEEAEDMEVPVGHYLQKVIVGKKWKWRIAKNSDATLPEYMTDHKEPLISYRVITEKETFLPLFDSTSKFLKKWDALTLLLLVFTATVTPFETAFMSSSSLDIDLLFLFHRFVDGVFAFDMFVQMRTPFRDAQTGQMVRDGNAIALRYLKSWFLIDLVSVLPFELLGFLQTSADSTNISELRLLRFLRLTRLLKLLRVLRASRKLRQWQVYINLRYATLQLVQYSVFIILLIHWLACGWRLASDKNNGAADDAGWVDHYAQYKGFNSSSDVNIWDAYLTSLYWSSATVSLVGPSTPAFAPTNVREYGFAFFSNFLAYMNAIYFIAILSDVLSVTSKNQRSHDLLVDQYLEMFDRLKLDFRLKLKVYEYLSDHYALAATSGYSHMLKELPTQLHGFITMEIFIDFLAQIPFLETFIDREPFMMQELCRNIEIKSFPANSHIFTEGYEGIYYIERGVCSVEGVVYMTGQVMGRSVLRENVKSTECRALTTVTVHLLTRQHLLAVLDKHPKIKYYAKRWTAWAVLRKFLKTYARLYYTAARRGSRMNPPLLTRRPHLRDGEFDDIDFAVLDHISEFGF